MTAPHVPVCSWCGAPLLSLAEMAALAVEALTSLEGMRLVVPDRTRANMRLLAAALPCRAGICKAKERDS